MVVEDESSKLFMKLSSMHVKLFFFFFGFTCRTLITDCGPLLISDQDPKVVVDPFNSIKFVKYLYI